MKKTTLFLMAVFFGVGAIFAQTTITGNVSDDTGPLPGASIVIKGTTTGVTTDFDGN